jgi:rhomboid family GlyGly-CTERM serine protease
MTVRRRTPAAASAAAQALHDGARRGAEPPSDVPNLSPPERFALAGAALLVLLHALGPGGAALVDVEALEYRADAVAHAPWRLLTAHLVHINWPHALINAAAWCVVARLYAPELPPLRQAWVLVVSALAISIGLTTLHPTIAWYRGFSGVLHALFFAGGLAWLLAALRGPRSVRALWLPVVLVLGGAIKVIAEQPVGSSTPFAEWLGAGTVPQAHLLGALTGALLGVLRGLRAPASVETR